jgi:hypothetical protein
LKYVSGEYIRNSLKQKYAIAANKRSWQDR